MVAEGVGRYVEWMLGGDGPPPPPVMVRLYFVRGGGVFYQLWAYVDGTWVLSTVGRWMVEYPRTGGGGG